jgi:hypothetical protein
MRHVGYTRNFESTIRLLAERGHKVHVGLQVDGFKKVEVLAKRQSIDDWMKQLPGVTVGSAPSREPGGWFIIAQQLRRSINYLRYLDARYRAAVRLRERAEQRAPRVVRWGARLPLVGTPWGRKLFAKILHFLERGVPDSEDVAEYLREQQPDVLLVTPLVSLSSNQVDYIRSAQRQGIRSGLCVYSWDNLTNKGLVHYSPEFVTVWNEAQRREAVELHDVPSSRVVVTGAPAYDQWFERKPSTSRAEFCRRVGLPDDRPYVLYLCSSPFIAPGHREAEFVRKWIGELRQSRESSLHDVNVLVRPHPQNAGQWSVEDLSDFSRVAVWPRAGDDPIDPRGKADYFDSLYHCAAVVGVNTSALIESAIVGRPVFTVLTGDFEDTQEGTLHFRHLVEVEGGLLNVAHSFEEHGSQLADALTRAGQPDPKSLRFVEGFVRPHGLGEAATPRMVAAIEGAVRRPAPAPKPRSASASAVGLMLRPVELVCWGGRGVNRRRLMSKGREAVAAAAGRQFDRLIARAKKTRTLRWLAVRYAKPAISTAMADAVFQHQVDVAPVVRDVQVLATSKSTRPVIVGPWSSEVGFEVLYWIPLLHWIKETEPKLAKRFVIVSRGGVREWYKGLGREYVDIFDIMPPEEFRLRREAEIQSRGGKQKQLRASRFEHEIIERVKQRLSVDEVDMLHPGVMYRILSQLRKQSAVQRYRKVSLHYPMKPPDLGPLAGLLPEDYIAVKFYFSYAFPDTEENRRFVRETIETLTEKANVVLLNTGMRIDDHADFEPTGSNRVIRLDHLMTPTNNLAIQTAAISRARAFVGTYGGLSYLPPHFGIPSICFYSDEDRFEQHHLEVARRIFQGAKWGKFVALDTHHTELLRLVMPELLGKVSLAT